MSDNFLYEGKAKVLYTHSDDEVRVYFKDDATAFNGVKKDVLADKGVYNNKITSIIYKYLGDNGISTHFVEQISDREQICKKVDIIPLEVIVRNIAAGSMAKRLGVVEGRALSCPVFELSYKDDNLGDPLINDDSAIGLDIVTREELAKIRETALKINELLKELFSNKGIILVDFKIEFGKDKNGKIILADEISPDTCRFWEKDTNEKFDKDRFRRDLSDVMKGYVSILSLLEEQN
ncbi:MAG: phosphoribosylaminoimidazolesuccinocarboxamide synthase [Lachnospirales bacterium]